MTVVTDNYQIGLDNDPKKNFILSASSGSMSISSGTASQPTFSFMTFGSNVTLFNGPISERANVLSSPPSSIQVYGGDTSITYHTANCNSNFSMNFTGLANTTVGTVASYVIMVTNNSTAYFSNTILIGNTSSGVTTRWQNSTPTSGNANKVDVYYLSIFKTSANTYSVFASQSNFT